MAEEFDFREQAISQLSLDGRVPVSQVYNPLNPANYLYRTVRIDGVKDPCPDFETEPDYSLELIFANDLESDQPEWYDLTMTPLVTPESLSAEEIQEFLGNGSPLNVLKDLMPTCQINPEAVVFEASYANIVQPVFAINEKGLVLPPWTKNFNPKKDLERKPYFFEITYPVPIGEMLDRRFGTLPGNHVFQNLLVTCGVRFANRNIKGINQKIMNELIDNPNDHRYQSNLGNRLRKIVDPYVSFSWQQ